YSVTVVLASFLMFAALGSRLSEVRADLLHDGRKIAITVPAIAAICVLYVAVLPAVLEH
ncbi:MAG: hypothetical protein GWO02_04900, partial [Gammaproteobacteria bacterium]|nr:hypothetical protein [Gammaproteobacteria bacterium]